MTVSAGRGYSGGCQVEDAYGDEFAGGTVRRDEDTSSEDRAHNESPATPRFFGQRTSHDTPRPSLPTAQKLRKRNVQEEKERDQDSGYKGGLATALQLEVGVGARKGPTRKRPALLYRAHHLVPHIFPLLCRPTSCSSSLASVVNCIDPGSINANANACQAQPS